MAKPWNAVYVLFGIVYALLMSGLTFQYMSSGKWMHVTTHVTTYLRSNTSNLLRSPGGSFFNKSHILNISSLPALLSPPKPTPSSRSIAIDWSGINNTSVDNLRKRIRKYIDGKLSIIVYKRTASLSDMIFQTNVTQLEKANVTEYLPHQDTCAIIGNSGILLDSGCGREIDAHDLVVRANSAPTLGYERDVGYRTGIMMFNRDSSLRIKRAFKRKPAENDRSQMFKGFDDTIVWYPLAPNGSGTGVLKSVAKQLGYDNFKIAYSIQSPMKLSRKLWRLRLPTTGLNMFSSMNYYCDKISLYGFFPFYEDSHGRRLQHHYFEKVNYNYTDSSHKMPREFMVLSQLRDSGALRLVTDRCNDGGGGGDDKIHIR